MAEKLGVDAVLISWQDSPELTLALVHDPRWAVGAFQFSAGIVDFDGGESAQTLLMRSDRAMYIDKTARRTASA